ncbi:MAG TPA: hypothetical protein VGT60_00470 [Candidatus Limnocylindria bacterium]|nr:hypothetical protein [Candidatus Limnocylindria bacterium]
MADKPRLPAVAGHLLGAVCAAAITFGAAANVAAAATIACGRVTTFVAPNTAGALNGGDGWLIFAKPDGTSDKVILRSGTLTPSGGISGYVCVGVEGVYLTGLLAPGTAGYVPEPAGWVAGTGVYCGTVAANPYPFGQLSGPRTFQLRGALTAFARGIFTVPASITLPTIGSYLCGRFEVDGPSALVTVVAPGDPGYVAAGLPNTATGPAGESPALEVAGAILIAAVALRATRGRTGSR